MDEAMEPDPFAGGGTGASPPDTPSFHDLLRQLGEAHDAEIAQLTGGIAGQSSRRASGSGTEDFRAPMKKSVTISAEEKRITIEDGVEELEMLEKEERQSESGKEVAKSASKKKKKKKAIPAPDEERPGNDDENWDEEIAPLVESEVQKDLNTDDEGAAPPPAPPKSSTSDEPTKTNRQKSAERLEKIVSKKSSDKKKTHLARQSVKDSLTFTKRVRQAKGIEDAEPEEEEKKGLKYSKYQSSCYVADAWLSQRRSQTVALVAAIFATVFFFGLIWTIFFADAELSFGDNLLEGFWIAWTYMADPGTHGDEETQARRFISSMIAVMGVLLMSMMMAMIIDVFQEKMESLRQGKAMVVEQGHTLIFGWNEKAVLIIEEMCCANESSGGGVIVVMSHIPKPDIEREFNLRFPVKKRMGTRVVFRTGNPMVTSDLMKVGAPTARASIILSNEGDPDNSDQETLRVVLALKTLPNNLDGHIVAELRDVDNEPVVKMVGGHEVEILVSHDLLGRLMLSAARQPGLGKVYETLFGFQGDEFYMSEWPELVGIAFGDLICRFPDAVPIGVLSEDDGLILNPSPDRRMQPGEKIYVIAEDDDTYKPEEPKEIDESEKRIVTEKNKKHEKILMCGWRRDIRDIVESLDSIVAEGSEIHMITSFMPVSKRNKQLLDEGLDVAALKRLKLVHHYGTPSVRRKLDKLPLSDYSSCMIFADQEFEQDTMKADSHSLAALLLLRDLRKQDTQELEADGDLPLSEINQICPVICEVLDPRTQKTIGANKYVKCSADFCQTNKIGAQILAMVAETRSVKVLFDELLGVWGNCVRVYPSTRYANSGEAISFWMLAKRASAMQETLFGFIGKADMCVVLNPPFKNERNVWDYYDMLVISASEM